MLIMKKIIPAFAGLILASIATMSADAQRRGGFGRGESVSSGQSQSPSPGITPQQPTPRVIQQNRPVTSSPGRSLDRPTRIEQPGNSAPPPRIIHQNRPDNNSGSLPNNNTTITNSRPRPGSGAVRNEPADLNPIQSAPGNGNTSNNVVSPKPRQRPGLNAPGGGGQQHDRSNSVVSRPAPGRGDQNWTRPPRQITRDDYRRAPLSYRYRYPGNRGRYSAYNPCWRYSYLPRYYSVIHDFYYPYSTIYWGGIGYRYCSGIFYAPFGSAVRVTPPPFGIYINILPMGYETIYGFSQPYYYYNGTFYDDYEDSYRVVAPPVGAIVESIPDGYETITIDGETYYKVDNIQYKPVVQDNGEIWYQVIKVG